MELLNKIGDGTVIVLCLGLAFFAYRIVFGLEKQLNIEHANFAMLAKIIRILAIVIIAILLLQNLGVQLSGVLTVSAAGSVVFALGAKDVLYNLGGGLMLQIDQMFEVGDEIKLQYSGNVVEGFVANIGWRITMLKTKSGKALYVPNFIFMTTPVENLSQD